MPRIFMALQKGERSPLVWILERTPSIPESCQWCNFLRNHDELTLEMVTEEERQWMWQEYAPEPRMRLNLGIRRRLAALLDNDQRKIELANSLLFTLPGSPIIYYGDEIGMGDDIWLPDRNGVRTPMQWDSGPNAGFSSALPDRLYAPVLSADPYSPVTVNVADQRERPDSIFRRIRNMIAVRKSHSAFGCGDFTWISSGTNAVAAYLRSTQDESILVVNNLSGDPQTVLLTFPGMASDPVDLILGVHYPQAKAERLSLPLSLEPYQYLWLKI